MIIEIEPRPPICEDPLFSPSFGFPIDHVDWSLDHKMMDIQRPGKVWHIWTWVDCWVLSIDLDGDFLIQTLIKNPKNKTENLPMRFPNTHVIVRELFPN